MYGNVKSYEGCTFLKEAFEKHSKFSAWYDRMEEKIEKGYPIEQSVVNILEKDKLKEYIRA